jgi:hypothetical protein
MQILEYYLFLSSDLPSWAEKSHPKAEIIAVFQFLDVEEGFKASEIVEKFYQPCDFAWRRLEIEGVGLALIAYQPRKAA